jgi:hypothetical protein
MASGCSDDGYEDERRAGAGGGVDQVSVASPVHGCRRDAARAGETVHGRDNGAGALDCRGDAAGVTDVTGNHLDAVGGQVPRAGWVAGQYPHREPLFG